MTNKERLEWFVVSLAALLWAATTIVNFFDHSQDLHTITVAFGGLAAMVLGAGAYSKYFKDKV